MAPLRILRITVQDSLQKRPSTEKGQAHRVRNRVIYITDFNIDNSNIIITVCAAANNKRQLILLWTDHRVPLEL